MRQFLLERMHESNTSGALVAIVGVMRLQVLYFLATQRCTLVLQVQKDFCESMHPPDLSSCPGGWYRARHSTCARTAACCVLLYSDQDFDEIFLRKLIGMCMLHTLGGFSLCASSVTIDLIFKSAR